MDYAASASASYVQVQLAFEVISTLGLTSYLWCDQPTVADGDAWDFIIVGGGSAGSIVASRLSEDPNNNVLLIEAGDVPPPESIIPNPHLYMHKSHVDWNYTSEDDGYTHQTQKNKVMSLTRGKMLGGTGAINFMMYVRGNPQDFDDWAEVVDSDAWKWENTLQYFMKSERLEDAEVLNSTYGMYHGTDGYLGLKRESTTATQKYLNAFVEAGHERILDSSGYNTLGWCEPLLNIADGVRQSTAYAFLTPNKDRTNLQILRNTFVSKVLFDDDLNAIGVEVITEDNETITLTANKEVVLSAGTLNSPTILMRSGVGPADHLEEMGIECIADLPVGDNFHDHPVIMVAFQMTNITPTAEKTNPTKLSIPLITGYMALNETQLQPDYQVPAVVIQDPAAALQFCMVFFGFQDSICNKVYEAADGKEMLVAVLNILHPKSRGTVRLRSTDPTAAPVVRTGFLSDDTDMVNFIRYLKHYTQVLDTQILKEAGGVFFDPVSDLCTEYESGTDEYWRCYVLKAMGNIYHYVGTCAMGSVVDADLRVKGINKLRVIDASTIPLITSGNTHAPTMMIAEKGADLIKETYA